MVCNSWRLLTPQEVRWLLKAYYVGGLRKITYELFFATHGCYETDLRCCYWLILELKIKSYMWKNQQNKKVKE